MRADLHTHTTCSDGTVAPKDLLQAAKAAGLNVLSITDHDTLRAYDLIEPDPELQIIPGVELSTSFDGYSVHLLAYSFSLHNPSMKELCQQQVLRREKRNEEILHRLSRMGCSIKPEELYFTPSDQIGSIGRPHIAKILVSKGFAHSMRDAFDRFIGEDAPAFAAGARSSVQDVLEIVHAANGFVVIAHPHYIKDKKVLQKMLQCPFDGIEAYYAHFTNDQVPYWLDIARQHNLFATGGSDFHGDVKPHHFLGSSLSPIDTLNLLLDRTEVNMPKQLEELDLDSAKAPGLTDRKSVNIANIDRLTIGQSRELSHKPKSNSSSCLGIMYNQILHSRSHSSTLDLARIQQASALFGHPERQFRSIHVGGTNGKGSVCHKIAKNLQMTGAKVGLYTSPHISSIRERIRINDELVDEEFLERHVPLMPSDLSFFEMMTLLAFIYFAKQKVDIAVIEVGLGGRLDATNIIKPELAVITSVDYDHQALLGATLPEIAQEKAGIIKKGVPVVLGPSAAKFIEAEHVVQAGGTYDEENTAIAHKALTLLDIEIFEEALKVRPPCRLETIKGVILDVAHNPAGLTKLFDALPVKPYIAVVGMSADKDIAAALQIIEKNVAEVHFVKAPTSRAAEPTLLQALWPAGKPALTFASVEEGLKAALQKGPVLVTGSFYIMAPARCFLGIDEPTDELVCQESFVQT